MTINVGVVGTGMIGTEHVRRLATEIVGSSVTAVYDVAAERAAQLTAQYGGRVHGSFDDLVADPDVDAVVLASPSPLHAEQTLACIAAGKPVLCEKPLGTTAPDALKVVDAEVALGRRLVQVGFMRRYDAALGAVKAAIVNGDLGEPLLAHAVHRNPTAPPGFRSEMVPYDVIVHEFDQFRWLFDQEIVATTAVKVRSTPVAGPELADPQIVLLEMANGAIIDVEAYVNCQYGYDVRCEIVCSTGSISVENPAITPISLSGHRSSPVPPDWRIRFGEAYRTELQQWIASLTDSGPVGPSAWDGYAAITVAESVVASLTGGERTPVSLVDKPSFYS